MPFRVINFGNIFASDDDFIMAKKKRLPPDPGRILFLLRRQGLYGSGGFDVRSSGLFNSATFIVDMLINALGYEAKLVIVEDSNAIDREVTNYNPRLVVIEALWATPAKMRELVALHPDRQFIMRGHSAIPFLAQEGMAMEWELAYADIEGVTLASNDLTTMREFQRMSGHRGLYLPNYYPPDFFPRPGYKTDPDIVNVGCFGAIRPLKNQLIQAIGAIRYAQFAEVELNFHMNTTRIEGGGDPILRNIQALFEATPNTQLVTYPWMSRTDFLALMRTMDAHMQVSFSETFNIVTADAVMNGVPVVISSAIQWADQYYAADPTNHMDIANVLSRAIQSPDRNVRENKKRLRSHDEMAIFQWFTMLNTL